jgi:hypothetical protein
MFERYTQKARRVMFFARYEASQYGSPYIESEYLLLGVLREDLALVTRFLGPNSVAADIRAEVARWIPARERISTSVEVPLTDECKKNPEPSGRRERETRPPVRRNRTPSACYVGGASLAGRQAPTRQGRNSGTNSGADGKNPRLCRPPWATKTKHRSNRSAGQFPHRTQMV